jgi:dipeptidyl aminopeptidase/acylaminoacyl peptidase
MTMVVMRAARAAVLAGVLAVSTVAVAQDPAPDPAADAAVFGAREALLDISLSPDGTKLAYIAPQGSGGEALYVVDLVGAPAPRKILGNADNETDLYDCTWVSDARLICGAHVVQDAGGALLGFSRLVILNSDGSGLQALTRSNSSRALTINQYGGGVLAYEIAGKPGKMLMQRQIAQETSINTRLAEEDGGLTVEELDIANLRTRRVEPPQPGAVGYIADDSGALRIRMLRRAGNAGNEGTDETYQYRLPGSDKWQELARGRVALQSQSGFEPIAVDSASNRVFGFDDKDGRRALYAISLDGTLERQELLARNDVDVDGLLRLGRRGRVIGASYATEKRQVDYTDPVLDKLSDGLAKALPGTSQIGFAGASADESKLLVVASSDVDPGMTYLFDKNGGKLEALLPIRAGMGGRKLGEMKPITYPAADGTVIPAYLTLPPGAASPRGLAAIVMPHGGPSARDEWGFDWLVQFFVARGYAVLQPNYRGSSGYGEAWFGKNGFQAWQTAIGDVADAGRWLKAEGVAADKLAIVGWSYGGYAALQSQVLDPALFRAVVAIAPVTDLEALREDARHFTSYAWVDKFVGQGPHVAAGSPARHADRFTAPVMLFHGTMDQNVSVRHSRLMSDRLRDAGKQVVSTEFAGLRHSLNDGAARTKMLASIDTFLDGALKR